MAPVPSSRAPEVVVLLHGIGMPSAAMLRIRRGLAHAGFRVVNHGYPWRAMTLEELAAVHLPAALRACEADAAPRLHFVAHSMGSLVVRLYLSGRRPANLGRVVLIGPPNSGSAVADRLCRSALCRWLIGPNLARLGTALPEAIAPRLAAPDYEVGVIAGTASINPVFSRWLAGPNDGAVSVASARLEGASGLLLVPHSHTAMLLRRAVMRQVLAFLRTGRFAS